MNKEESIFLILNNILGEQQDLLRKISAKTYTADISSLDGSTIGRHTRHIIEFLEILLASYNNNTINYDERKRNLELEENPEKAAEAISHIVSSIKLPNRNLILQQTIGSINIQLNTNFYRELLYNIEHCIHHQALIKVACNDIGISYLLSRNFGVAYSTIQYRENQNQN